MSDIKDETPLTENLADVAAAEGVAEPPKRKRGRPPGPNAGKRDRSAEYRERYQKQKAAKAGGAKTETGPTPSQTVPDEPPFTAEELRSVMQGVGSALFALPGEAMATRMMNPKRVGGPRPDVAAKMTLGEGEAALGGKAVVYYFAKRFPDFMDKWGPEMFLFGTAAIVYGPRILLMVRPPEVEATVDGKPAGIRAV